MENISNETAVDDGEIIRRVISGDREEFRLLVVKYQEQIFRMLLRQTGDTAVSRDLCQETFLAAFRALQGFKGESKFPTWLTRIALNLAKNYFRSKAYRERRIAMEPEISHQSDQKEEVEERLLKLREFIADLKPIYRDVIVLCGLEKKSYEEASAILQIPVGTVRSRLNTGRLKLREMFFARESV
jgi:RNA polymerase sigma-70 factor, ECF subfamily